MGHLSTNDKKLVGGEQWFPYRVNEAIEDSDITADYSVISGNDTGTDVTAAELEELTDGSTTTLHTHSLTEILSVVSIDDTDSPYSLGTATQVVLCDATNGAITVNLYSASQGAGRIRAICIVN
jgi:hypothetical protein